MIQTWRNFELLTIKKKLQVQDILTEVKSLTANLEKSRTSSQRLTKIS